MMNKLVQLLQPVEGELEKDVKSAFCFVVMKVPIFKAFLFRIIFNMDGYMISSPWLKWIRVIDYLETKRDKVGE